MSNQFVYLNNACVNNSKLEQFDTGIIKSEHHDYISVLFQRINQEITLHTNNIVKFDIDETGDRFANKVCDRCFKFLNTEKDFENNRIKKGGLITKRPSCRVCRKAKNGKSISITEREKWEKIRPQKGSYFTCPICQKTTIVGIVKVVLDHNHHTGKVRGWLCESCNTGIGRFDDSPELVERAKSWLLGRLR